MKKAVPFIAVVSAFLLMIAVVVTLSVKSYKDKNTWAVFEITQTSSHGVVSTKEYLKGERLEIRFATVMVDEVHMDDYAVISSEDADLIFHGKTLREVKLIPGEEVGVRKDGNYYTVKMVSAYYW